MGQCTILVASVHRKWPDVAPDPTVVFAVRSRLVTKARARVVCFRPVATLHCCTHDPRGYVWDSVRPWLCPCTVSGRTWPPIQRSFSRYVRVLSPWRVLVWCVFGPSQRCTAAHTTPGGMCGTVYDPGCVRVSEVTARSSRIVAGARPSTAFERIFGVPPPPNRCTAGAYRNRRGRRQVGTRRPGARGNLLRRGGSTGAQPRGEGGEKHERERRVSPFCAPNRVATSDLPQ